MEKKVNQELYKKLKKVNCVLRVEKNKLLEERTALKKWGNDLSRLNELSKAIVGTLDTDKIVITAFTKMQEVVPHDVSSVVLFKQKKLWVLSPMKLYVDDTEDIKKFALDTIKKVVDAEDENNYKIEVKCLNDVEAETSVFNSRISNRLIFPMEIGDMRIGALHLIRKPDEPFSEHEQKLAAMIVSTLTLALRNSEIHREVQELATIDSLTGLFNNRYFHEILTREFKSTMRYQNPVSLIMIDLDNFKQINDQYGHQAGDTVLREISNRLTRSLRDIDVPARYGGDEIAIILPETLIEPAFFVAKRIKTLIEAQPIKFKENNINVTASLGIASCPDPKMRSVEDMIAVADKALYDAKKYGRNRIEVNKDIFIQDNAYLGPLVF
jgi:diguanylate cyclase (GGDEF)-like protein